MRCFAGGANANGVQLHVPPGDFNTFSQVWADQMLTPVLDVGSSSRHYLFQTVRALDKVSKDPSAVRYICGISESPKAESYEDSIEELKSQDGLLSYFTYTSEIRLDKEPWTDIEWSRMIRSDMRFLVLLAEVGYVVQPSPIDPCTIAISRDLPFSTTFLVAATVNCEISTHMFITP